MANKTRGLKKKKSDLWMTFERVPRRNQSEKKIKNKRKKKHKKEKENR